MFGMGACDWQDSLNVPNGLQGMGTNCRPFLVDFVSDSLTGAMRSCFSGGALCLFS
jgi:hypothetical protein